MKVDAQIEEDCRQTISYLKGYNSYLKLYCKKQSNQKRTVNTVSTTRRTTLRWVLSNIKELLFIKLSDFVFVPPALLKSNLNKAKYSFYEKLSRVFCIAGSQWSEIRPPTPAVLLTIHFSAVMKPSGIW